MSLSNVFDVGDVVYVETTHTKAAGQSGTPTSVTATVTLEDPTGATVDPAPTATVTVDGTGVATVTWSHNVGSTSAAAAGYWKFRVVTDGDLVDAYDGCFYVRQSEVV